VLATLQNFSYGLRFASGVGALEHRCRIGNVHWCKIHRHFGQFHNIAPLAVGFPSYQCYHCIILLPYIKWFLCGYWSDYPALANRVELV
jgi:hypothetical protein